MSTHSIPPSLPLRGTLYTLGYAQPGTDERVSQLMSQEHTMLLDIRYSPYSRWYPAWTGKHLAATYGDRYTWEIRLGNLNYRNREAGIRLVEGHKDAIQEAALLLTQGTSLILLCACKDARTCHRSLVARLIQDAVDALHERGRA